MSCQISVPFPEIKWGFPPCTADKSIQHYCYNWEVPYTDGKAGSIIANDATPGNKRIELAHAEGQRMIMNNEGELGMQSTENFYLVVGKDKNITITGNKNEAIQGYYAIKAEKVVIKADVDIIGNVRIDGTLSVSGDTCTMGHFHANQDITTDATVHAIGVVRSDVCCIPCCTPCAG